MLVHGCLPEESRAGQRVTDSEAGCAGWREWDPCMKGKWGFQEAQQGSRKEVRVSTRSGAVWVKGRLPDTGRGRGGSVGAAGGEEGIRCKWPRAPGSGHLRSWFISNGLDAFFQAEIMYLWVKGRRKTKETR